MRPNKYRNKPTAVGGRTYASKAEAQRAQELELMRRAGIVTYWMPQPSVELAGIRYKPDFMVCIDGDTHFEDVKGVETQRFRDVRKLWQTSGPTIPLHVLKRKAGGWIREVIVRGAGNAPD